MVKELDSGFEATEFEPQSRNYGHFRIKSLEKGMKPL